MYSDGSIDFLDESIGIDNETDEGEHEPNKEKYMTHSTQGQCTIFFHWWKFQFIFILSFMTGPDDVEIV